MIFGGIPYYLGYFDGGLSLSQNVDRLLFSPNASLANEYQRLFNSLFTNPDTIKRIVELLATRRYGFSVRDWYHN